MKKLIKSFIHGAVIIFIASSFYLGYRYVHAVSEKIPTKGGTVVEGVVGQLNYMPYTSTRKTDKFFQSLLFK